MPDYYTPEWVADMNARLARVATDKHLMAELVDMAEDTLTPERDPRDTTRQWGAMRQAVIQARKDAPEIFEKMTGIPCLDPAWIDSLANHGAFPFDSVAAAIKKKYTEAWQKESKSAIFFKPKPFIDYAIRGHQLIPPAAVAVSNPQRAKLGSN